MSPKVAKANRFSQGSLTERERLGTVDLLVYKKISFLNQEVLCGGHLY